MKFALSILRALELVAIRENDFMKGRAKKKCAFKLMSLGLQLTYFYTEQFVMSGYTFKCRGMMMMGEWDFSSTARGGGIV